jgi:excinuclease ABC subunit A
MKLARELSKRQTGKTLYLLDEPTTGLHFDDVRKLLEVLHRLVDLGNSVMIIEHNLDVIRNADWVIDLGPEGGEDGGRIVGEGRPAKIAATPDSYTGQFLKRYYKSENGRFIGADPDESMTVDPSNGAVGALVGEEFGVQLVTESADAGAKSEVPSKPDRRNGSVHAKPLQKTRRR